MNCKPGDLAIIIKTHPTNSWGIGKIVKVVELSPSLKDSWIIEVPPPYPDFIPSTTKFRILDCLLKPVSGLPLQEDETKEEVKPLSNKEQA